MERSALYKLKGRKAGREARKDLKENEVRTARARAIDSRRGLALHSLPTEAPCKTTCDRLPKKKQTGQDRLELMRAFKKKRNEAVLRAKKSQPKPFLTGVYVPSNHATTNTITTAAAPTPTAAAAAATTTQHRMTTRSRNTPHHPLPSAATTRPAVKKATSHTRSKTPQQSPPLLRCSKLTTPGTAPPTRPATKMSKPSRTHGKTAPKSLPVRIRTHACPPTTAPPTRPAAKTGKARGSKPHPSAHHSPPVNIKTPTGTVLRSGTRATAPWPSAHIASPASFFAKTFSPFKFGATLKAGAFTFQKDMVAVSPLCLDVTGHDEDESTLPPPSPPSQEQQQQTEPIDFPHFIGVHSEATKKLSDLCQQWEEFDATGLSEEVADQVTTTPCRARLLIRSKMAQYLGLVRAAEDNRDTTTTTAADLQGFWEMVCIQIELVLSQFSSLDTLKSNNWEPTTDPTPLPSSSSSSTSPAPAAAAAARKKRKAPAVVKQQPHTPRTSARLQAAREKREAVRGRLKEMKAMAAAKKGRCSELRRSTRLQGLTPPPLQHPLMMSHTRGDFSPLPLLAAAACSGSPADHVTTGVLISLTP